MGNYFKHENNEKNEKYREIDINNKKESSPIIHQVEIFTNGQNNKLSESNNKDTNENIKNDIISNDNSTINNLSSTKPKIINLKNKTNDIISNDNSEMIVLPSTEMMNLENKINKIKSINNVTWNKLIQTNKIEELLKNLSLC